MLPHKFFRKTKQDGPVLVAKYCAAKSFLLNDWPEENAHFFFIHQRNTQFTCSLFKSGKTYLRYQLKTPSLSHVNTQSHHHHQSLECCCFSLCIHLLIYLIMKMSSSINFLLFASTDGKRKILKSLLGSTKAKSRVKRWCLQSSFVSSWKIMWYIRQCSKSIKGWCNNDDYFTTVSSTKDFIILPLHYYFSLVYCIFGKIWWRVLKWYVGGQQQNVFQSIGKLRFHNVKIYKRIQRTHMIILRQKSLFYFQK